ncbi:hypothetical protein [Streptococcus thoraltensis]|uniref:hypothetical protein n=1 Tax=Streptococcus thoraltensis TaxID=55085 RepID=UPI001F5989DF|nr:hypothetical protein [Streptococcus thoraltensis]
MLKSKSEMLFLFLSILLLIAIGGIYMIANKSSQEQSASQVTRTSQSSSSGNAEDNEAAEKAVKALEDNPNDDNLKKAKEALAKLPKGDLKDKLQKRIDAVEAILKQEKTAEKAIKQAEKTLSATDIDAAQKEIDKLKDGDKKTALQKQLDDVRQTLNAGLSSEVPLTSEEIGTETGDNEGVDNSEVVDVPQNQPNVYAPATPAAPGTAPLPETNQPEPAGDAAGSSDNASVPAEAADTP